MTIVDKISKYRKLAILIFYTIGLFISYFVSWQLRFDFSVPDKFGMVIFTTSIWIIPLKLIVLSIANQFSGLLSYFGVRDLIRLFFSVLSSSIIILILWVLFYSKSIYIPPRGVILIDFVSAFVVLAAIRLCLRIYKENQIRKPSSKFKECNLAIIGAGIAGANLVKQLLDRKHSALKPLVFFDDDPNKINSYIHGIPIVGKPEELLNKVNSEPINKIIIALPITARKRIKEVVSLANQIGIKCDIIPSIEELTTGKVTVSSVRKVQIHDLLQRDPIELETENINDLLSGKTVVVTGAGGTIGSELCRQILRYDIKQLILIEQSEYLLFLVEQEINKLNLAEKISTYVLDILNTNQLKNCFDHNKPNIVFHAAAHKHVYLMEKQPDEAFMNNTIGTIKLAELSLRSNVEQFIMVSTDKAINPTSVMGATKRLAEIYIQAIHQEGSTSTKFSAVRFGNVLGSSGSVVPIFEKQIIEGGPVKVTHPEVTRFFMTTQEAVSLILQAGSQSEGGEIFVLDMGKSIKIVDLAKQLIELSGLVPFSDIDIEFIGLKPGEKLYEEINHAREDLGETNHSKILKFKAMPNNYKEIKNNIRDIEAKLNILKSNEVKLAFKNIITEYKPYF